MYIFIYLFRRVPTIPDAIYYQPLIDISTHACIGRRPNFALRRRITTGPHADHMDHPRSRRKKQKQQLMMQHRRHCRPRRVMAQRAHGATRWRPRRKRLLGRRKKTRMNGSPTSAKRHEEATGTGIERTVWSVSTAAVTFPRPKLVGHSMKHRSTVFGGGMSTRDTHAGKRKK